MKEIVKSDLAKVSGGFFWFRPAVGCAIGAGSYYAFAKKPSWQGAVYSCAVGAVGNVAANYLVGAAGGGILGNLSQRPGMMGLSWGAQQAAPGRK
ncbi:hypothetical protein H9A57_004595 [Salmonella enterica]|nr:hypothetical protein [Salmonella enterica]EGH3757453.1 hypothetical protein [Salmonella enterica]EIM6766245.1 hypothetical protein [Salmonella enterica]